MKLANIEAILFSVCNYWTFKVILDFTSVVRVNANKRIIQSVGVLHTWFRGLFSLNLSTKCTLWIDAKVIHYVPADRADISSTWIFLSHFISNSVFYICVKVSFDCGRIPAVAFIRINQYVNCCFEGISTDRSTGTRVKWKSNFIELGRCVFT